MIWGPFPSGVKFFRILAENSHKISEGWRKIDNTLMGERDSGLFLHLKFSKGEGFTPDVSEGRAEG